MSLLDLPNELLLLIAENFDKLRDLSAFARTNQRLCFLLTGYLYRIDVQQGGSSTLIWAAEHGREGTAQLSLTEGADREATRENGRQSTCIHRKAVRCDLLPPKFQASNHDFFRRRLNPLTSLTPVQIAVCYKHETVVQLLVEHGANVKKAYPTWMARCTPLHLASGHGLIATVKLLLDKGAKLEARDEDGRTPLHYAIRPDMSRPRWLGSVEMVSYLLDKGAKDETQDTLGRRPKDLLMTTGWGCETHIQDQIRQLLEAKEAKRIVEKWDRDRDSSKKKRLAADKALQEELAHRNRERTTKNRVRKETQQRVQEELRKIAEETKAAQRRRDAERLAAQQKAKEELQKIAEETQAAQRSADEARRIEISLRERQAAARTTWSQLRQQAEGKTADGEQVGTSSAPASSSACPHASIGWFKNKDKTRAQCQRCERMCAKVSFRCPDCGFVACRQCV